jgi:hypothetical protein
MHEMKQEMKQGEGDEPRKHMMLSMSAVTSWSATACAEYHGPQYGGWCSRASTPVRVAASTTTVTTRTVKYRRARNAHFV